MPSAVERRAPKGSRQDRAEYNTTQRHFKAIMTVIVAYITQQLSVCVSATYLIVNAASLGKSSLFFCCYFFALGILFEQLFLDYKK